MTVRKVETEILRSSVSETRAKSAVMGAASALLAKVASSDPQCEALTQQIAYLMSAVTNQNSRKTNGYNGSKSNNGNSWNQKGIEKIWSAGGGGTGHSWRECSRPRQGNNLPFKPTNKNQNQNNNQNLNSQWARKCNPPILSQWWSRRNQHQQTTKTNWESNGLKYYNPNPWVRILGRANETEIEIDGTISKALIDSGAMLSMMSKGYGDEHRYEIQPFDQLGPIEGGWGADVPYLSYVEVRMHIPGISSFDQNVLMLISHTTTPYHRRVPIQVGNHIIGQVTNCITEDELQSLSQSWKLAYVSTTISKSLQVSDQEFDLDQVKGKVITTNKVKVPAFQTVIATGLTKVTGHQNHVHVLVEPPPKCKSIFVPGNTSKLISGGSGVAVVLRNLSGRDVTLELHTEVGTVTTANIVPPIHIPGEQDLGKKEKVQCMSAHANLSEGVQQEDTGDILQKLIYQGLMIGIPKYNKRLDI